MRSLVRVTLLALLATTFTAPLAAQDIRQISNSPRSGFWWGLGLGAAASSTLHCESGCDSFDKTTIPLGDIHLGITPSPKLTLGLEFTGGEKDGAFSFPSGVKGTVGDVNASAYFYPQATGNFFIQGGIAAVVWQVKQDSNWDRLVTGGLTLGAGYDIRIGRNTSITPVVRGVWGAKGRPKDQDGNDVSGGQDFNLSYVHAGVSILWH